MEWVKAGAVVVGAMGIATAILVSARWDFAITPNGAAVRFDRWTGEITACRAPSGPRPQVFKFECD